MGRVKEYYIEAEEELSVELGREPEWEEIEKRAKEKIEKEISWAHEDRDGVR